MDTLTIVKAPGVLRERLDTLISRFGDSSSFVEPRADAPRSLCEAAELIEGSIHRLPFQTIRYATEYRGYYVLSYASTDYWAAPTGVRVTGQDVKELFTEGWLLKKGEVKFRGFRLAEREKSKE
jgi:hypothetical protein